MPDETAVAFVAAGSAPSRSSRKYRSSCNNCRKSRVKCSGGNPCVRCKRVASCSPCVYSVSRRQGRQKAGAEPLPSETAVQYENQWTPPLEASVWNPPSEDMWDQSIIPSGTDLLKSTPHIMRDFIEASDHPHPLVDDGVTDLHHDTYTCHMAIQQAGDKLANPETQNMGHILQLLRDGSRQAEKYLACLFCDQGCPHLMNLAVLHQRQTNALRQVSKDPYSYLDESVVRLGAFQPAEQDSLAVKKLLLLGATRDLRACVDEFLRRTKSYQDEDESGASALTSAGRINLNWLLSVGENLMSRLDCIKSSMEDQSWGLPRP